MPRLRPGPAFAPVEVRKLTTLKGGLLKRPSTVPVLEVKVGDQRMEFVHMTVNQEWLCRAVTGEPHSKRPMARVGLLRTLAAKLIQACSGMGDDLLPVQPGHGGDVALDDPMNALDFVADVVAKAPVVMGGGIANVPKGNKRVRKSLKKNTILRITMPEKCPEQFPESKCTRDVTLWIKGKRELWLGVEHVAWAVEYMHAQALLGGIPVAGAEPVQPVDLPSGSASLTDASSISWDFRTNGWKASVTKGGVTKHRCLKPCGVQVGEASTVVEGLLGLEGRPYPELKEIARKILQAWCESESEV